MDDETFQKFKGLFISTANDYLSKIEKTVTDPSFLIDPVLAGELYIQSHALKGQSYAMQFSSLASASKMLESVFALLKEKKVRLDSSQIAELQILLQAMRESVRVIESSGKERDLAIAMRNFQKLFPTMDLLSL